MPLSDNKGIWLFYSKKGNLISKVPNGNSIRQGGSFTLIFAFEDDSYMNHKNLSVSFRRPGDKSDLGPYPAGERIEVRFEKYKANEITYGLVDGKVYNVYKQNFPALENGLTSKYGNLNVVAKIKDESDEDMVYYEGAVQLYIEPTFGKNSESSLISQSEKDILVNEINKVANGKLNKVNGEASLLKITTEATLPEHAITKAYADEIDERKLNKYGDTANNLKVEKIAEDELDVINKKLFDSELKQYVMAKSIEEEGIDTPVVLNVAETDSSGRHIADTFDFLIDKDTTLEKIIGENEKKSLTYNKTWISNKEYNINDIVIAEDENLYICKRNSVITTIDPSLDQENWELLELATRKFVENKIKEKKHHFVLSDLTELQLLFSLDINSNYEENYNIGEKTTIDYKGKTYDLTTGDVFYIISTDVPDYWIDLENKSLHALEGVASSSTVIDLSKYATNDRLNEVESKIPYDNSQIDNGAGYITANDTIATATNAINDENGNNIVNTYATKVEVPQISIKDGVLEITFKE